MQQIRSKVKQLSKQSTKKAYQNAIKYLLSVTENLLDQRQINLMKINKQNLSGYKERRFYSMGTKRQKNYSMEIYQRKNKDKIDQVQQNQVNSNSQQVFYDCFSGSQLSFVQKINEKINKQQQNQQDQQINKQKKYKIDRRKLQQTIEIYHQCLGRALDVLKKQHGQIIKLIKQQKISNRIDQFWQKFNNYKNKCKTFDDLIYVVHTLLAKQFLTALKPYQKTIKNISIKLTNLKPRIVCIQTNK